MEFKTDVQKACYEKTAAMMKDLFGEMAMARDDVPLIGLVMGSALVNVGVHPWGTDDAVICGRSYVVFGADITPDLMQYLLRKNDEMRFGAFGLDSDNDIFFEHSIVGSTCDKAELRATVMAVLSTADLHDDEIMARWGGERAIDKAKKGAGG